MPELSDLTMTNIFKGNKTRLKIRDSTSVFIHDLFAGGFLMGHRNAIDFWSVKYYALFHRCMSFSSTFCGKDQTLFNLLALSYPERLLVLPGTYYKRNAWFAAEPYWSRDSDWYQGSLQGLLAGTRLTNIPQKPDLLVWDL